MLRGVVMLQGVVMLHISRQHVSTVKRPSSGLYRADHKSTMDLVLKGIPLCSQWSYKMLLKLYKINIRNNLFI
jgi:hypothetical protein